MVTHISAWVGVKVGSLKECVAIIIAVVVVVDISVVEDAVVVVTVLVVIASVMVDISLFKVELEGSGVNKMWRRQQLGDE